MKSSGEKKIAMFFEQIKKDIFPELSIYGASNDLLKNDWLSVPKRTKKMMPKPFVLNDAIITKQTIDTKKELEK